MARQKPTHIAEIEAELTELQAQRDEIDLDELQRLSEEAQAAWAQYAASDSYVPAFRDGKPASDEPPERERRRITAGVAKNMFENAKLRAKELDPRIATLAAMLSGDARMREAQEAVDHAAKDVAVAAEVVASAQEAVDRLRSLLDAANAEHAQDLDAAARDALHAVKQGLTPTAPAADRSRVAALEAALVLAQAELAAATESKAEVEKATAKATEHLQAAQRDAAKLQFRLVVDTFALGLFEFLQVPGIQAHHFGRNFPLDEVNQALSRIQSARADQRGAD